MSTTNHQQFSYLSDAMLHHRLNVTQAGPGSTDDWSVYQNKYYWPQGPLPAIILMPFVALFSLFHLFFYQSYLQVVITMINLVMLFKLARKLKYDGEDSAIWAFGFLLGSAYIGIIALSMSWFFAQAITVLLLLLALYEYVGQKRWWLIGLFCAGLALTRISAAPIALFFILESKSLYKDSKQWQKAWLQIISPVVVAGLILALYNYARFHSIFEQGYRYQYLRDQLLATRRYGVYSIVHFPANIYYAFLAGPLPVFRDHVSEVLRMPFIKNNPWGMSIFFSSPYLLWLFNLRKSDFNHTTRNLLIAVAVSMVMIFGYYGIGYYQIGYRYALDFLPLILLILMIKYRERQKKLSSPMKFLLIGSGMFNFYLLLTFILNNSWAGLR
ncbi:MAG TPA: hypothetical protein VLF39_04210 [Candidatus Saccharimonadales bacterium]|nr:hypothetical protein [Candidatus Saccharimonadales bacterium]